MPSSGSDSASALITPVSGVTEYPDDDDLSTFLVSAGFDSDAVAALDLAGFASAASAEWERKVGWFPFLSSGIDEARSFYPSPTGLIDLDGGLLSLTSLTVSGTAYTNNQQFTLEPMTAPNRGRPYTGLNWGCGGGYYNPFDSLAFSWGGPNFSGGARVPIVVTGKWGYCLTLPADVFQAVLEKAAVRPARLLLAADPNARYSTIQKQSASLKMDTKDKSLEAKIAMWDASMAATLRDGGYRRVVIA